MRLQIGSHTSVTVLTDGAVKIRGPQGTLTITFEQAHDATDFAAEVLEAARWKLDHLYARSSG